MQTSLLIIGYSLVLLLFITLSLFLYIVLRRIILKSLEKKFDRKYQKIEKDILALITFPDRELSAEIARRHQSHPKILTKVLFDYIEQIEGQGKDELKKIFDYSLKIKCLKDIYSRRLIKRLRAIHLFVVFSEPTETVHIMRLLNDKPLVRLVAVQALSRIRSPHALSYIFQAFERDSNSNARTYINIMFGLGAKIEYQVKTYLRKSLSLEKLGLLIELAGAIPLRSLYQDIIFFAHHPDKEIRTKVARALGKMLIPDSFEILSQLSQDDVWIVRAQAIKSLGNLKDLRALDILTDGLFSPFWHVRYNAGYSLASLGLSGIKRLRAVSQQKEDPYASDMAVMVMDEIVYSEGRDWMRL
jgi:predicted transcriptional regulator with HTH domain